MGIYSEQSVGMRAWVIYFSLLHLYLMPSSVIKESVPTVIMKSIINQLEVPVEQKNALRLVLIHMAQALVCPSWTKRDSHSIKPHVIVVLQTKASGNKTGAYLTRDGYWA